MLKESPQSDRWIEQKLQSESLTFCKVFIPLLSYTVQTAHFSGEQQEHCITEVTKQHVI